MHTCSVITVPITTAVNTSLPLRCTRACTRQRYRSTSLMNVSQLPGTCSHILPAEPQTAGAEAHTSLRMQRALLPERPMSTGTL